MAALEVILICGAVATAIGAVCKFVILPIASAVNAVHKTYESVSDQDERLKVVEARSAELVNNSGSSMKDAIGRIERGQTEQKEAFDAHLTWAQAELLAVWQNLASRDAVEAAAKVAESFDERG